MAKFAAKPKLSLRLLIDEKKNRVILAEAGKDFVDVLCSLLTLPMGTIVRLLEKHQTPQSSIVGCFHNLYKSVSDMSVDNFETQACKNLLLYPRSIKESHSGKLKLNIDDTEATKFLSAHILSPAVSVIELDGRVLNVLNDLGYAGFDKLQEKLVDVGSEEVLTLLGCLFTSEAPLSDTFLRKPCTTRKRKALTPLVQENGLAGDADKFLTVKVYVRKTDMTILYAECREDFIDFLFSFLVIPLEFAWEFSIDNVNMGCVGNLCRSVKDLSFENQKEATVSKCMLPYYYNFRAHPLDIVIQKGVSEYEGLLHCSGFASSCSLYKFSRKIKKDVLSIGERIVKIAPMDYGGVGFGKGESNFIVSDDLFITPMSTSSTVLLLSKLQMNISDIEEQVINISKAEAVSFLRASLITTSALTNGLSNFLSKIKPQEATRSTSKIPKSEKTL